jgi:hypothetical protein
MKILDDDETAVKLCVVCNHEQRKEIERALIAGTSGRQGGTAYGVGRAAVARHYANHVRKPATRTAKIKKKAKALVEVDEIAAAKFVPIKIDHAGVVMSELSRLYNEAMKIAARAES